MTQKDGCAMLGAIHLRRRENKMASMDKEEHLQRHLGLHKCLDELFADYIATGQGSANNTILELIKWSHKQTKKPDRVT